MPSLTGNSFKEILIIAGGIAQLARVRDWQSRGQGFDSPYLHKMVDSFYGIDHFLLLYLNALLLRQSTKRIGFLPLQYISVTNSRLGQNRI